MEGTVTISDAIAEVWGDDPAYDRFGFGSYLGTTVSAGDSLYGTLCLVGADARDDPLRDKEKTLVEMYSQWVVYTLDRVTESPLEETRIDVVERRAVSPDAIDSMMDAIQSRTRRVILRTLLDDSETSVGALERQLDHENARRQLYHRELPRLATGGYIEWDTESETISKGPRSPR